MAMASNPYAAVAITKHGVEKARTLTSELPQIDLYYMGKLAHGDEEELGYRLFDEPVKRVLADLFQAYQGLILFISLGAVVRMIAPVLEDKKKDPAVVVVDECGLHAVSVLSGHLGGANELTLAVAEALGASPVITTASDVQGTIAVDLLGREFGWTLDGADKLKAVSAAVVNEERIAVVQEAGETRWWPGGKPFPAHFALYARAEEAVRAEFDAALVITDRLLEESEESALLRNGVLYRPKTLVLGIGCNRGTPAEEIEHAIISTLSELRLSIRSVRNVASIVLKQDEAGLLDVCRTYNWALALYTADELNQVRLKAPSETVFKHTGAYGVSEPAALCSSGAADWLLEKRKLGNVTLSIARVPFPPSGEAGR